MLLAKKQIGHRVLELGGQTLRIPHQQSCLQVFRKHDMAKHSNQWSAKMRALTVAREFGAGASDRSSKLRVIRLAVQDYDAANIRQQIPESTDAEAAPRSMFTLRHPEVQ